jgi:hypothetical protein
VWFSSIASPRTDAQIAAAPGAGGVTLELLRLEVPAAAFTPEPPERAAYARQLLYRKAGFLLGGPIWLQHGPWGLTSSFVGQYDERLAPGANFGDAGMCYAFADHAEWQSPGGGRVPADRPCWAPARQLLARLPREALSALGLDFSPS